MQTTIKYLLVSFIFLLTSQVFSQTSEDKFIIVLDAGHGGHDPGRPTKFAKESDVALKIVLNIGKELEKNKDIKVIYTRKTDVFLELYERAAIANKADADLFVSIHCNAHHTQAYGTETYVLSAKNSKRNFDIAKAENEVIFLEENYEKNYEGFNPNSPESLIGLTLQQEEYVDQSISLAKSVESNFKTKLNRKSRGVKQISLWVMHNTYMPSVLIETGFLTNNVEGKYLSSKKGQKEISLSIVNSIVDYIKGLSVNYNDNDFAIKNDLPSEIISTEKEVYEDVTFKIQIAASTRKLEPVAYNFKGLDQITRQKQGKIYRYFYGQTSDYLEAKRRQLEAKEKGYKDCYIAAFKDGERVNIRNVLKK